MKFLFVLFNYRWFYIKVFNNLVIYIFFVGNVKSLKMFKFFYLELLYWEINWNIIKNYNL